jgi:hypothetical protein
MRNSYLIAITIFIFIIYSQYIYINTMPLSSSYEIVQVNNPDKQTFEKIINEKQPSIFTNILEGIEFAKYNLNENIGKKEMEFDLNKHFKYYLHPLTLKYDFEIFQNKQDTNTPIFKQTHYRYIIGQLHGVKKILLFSPHQENYLYPDHQKNQIQSKLDFWNISSREEYPLINKSKYIEIIIKPNQMIYIPHKWWYTIHNITDSVSVSCHSETLFSYFLKQK